MEKLSQNLERETYTVTLDEDPAIHSLIEQATGMRSKWFSSGESLTSDASLNPVAVFADARMSLGGTLNGQLISKLKDTWPLSPVIMTSKDEEQDILTEAMALGADDFIGKPIRTGEIMARLAVRMNALKRRAARETIMIGDLTIDTLQRSVSSGKGQKFLSPTEIKLVFELAKSNGAVVPRELLKKRCWPGLTVSDNALNRKLYEVRKRISPLSGRISIRTIYGVGFLLEETS